VSSDRALGTLSLSDVDAISAVSISRHFSRLFLKVFISNLARLSSKGDDWSGEKPHGTPGDAPQDGMSITTGFQLTEMKE